MRTIDTAKSQGRKKPGIAPGLLAGVSGVKPNPPMLIDYVVV